MLNSWLHQLTRIDVTAHLRGVVPVFQFCVVHDKLEFYSWDWGLMVLRGKIYEARCS